MIARYDIPIKIIIMMACQIMPLFTVIHTSALAQCCHMTSQDAAAAAMAFVVQQVERHVTKSHPACLQPAASIIRTVCTCIWWINQNQGKCNSSSNDSHLGPASCFANT